MLKLFEIVNHLFLARYFGKLRIWRLTTIVRLWYLGLHLGVLWFSKFLDLFLGVFVAQSLQFFYLPLVSIDFGYLFLDSIVYLLLVTFDQLFRWFFHVGLAMILVAVHACKIWLTLPLLLIIIMKLLKLDSGLYCWCLHYVFLLLHNWLGSNIILAYSNHRSRLVFPRNRLCWIRIGLHRHTKSQSLHPQHVLSFILIISNKLLISR